MFLFSALTGFSQNSKLSAVGSQDFHLALKQLNLLNIIFKGHIFYAIYFYFNII